MSEPDIAIIGGGKIGEALLAGLLRGGRDGADIAVTERYPERAAFLHDTYGVVTSGSADAVARARIVIVATKPNDLEGAVAQFASSVTPQHLIVSVAAGIGCERIERGLPAGVPVVRAMPNTPALVGAGITALAAGTHATTEHLDAAESLLAGVGRVVRVPEKQLDAVTALSGSGPAYFFLVAEAMIDAGVLLGLARPLATELVVQTALGSATMLTESGEHPVALREAVSSPAGTTVAAVRELEVHGLRAAFIAAAEAAAARSAELGAAG